MLYEVITNDLCDRLGMDTITAGNLCAFVIEAVKRGKLDYPIDYGDADAVAGLVERIARREGLGAILADGIVPAARHFGLEDLAVHVKGMEPRITSYNVCYTKLLRPSPTPTWA